MEPYYYQKMNKPQQAAYHAILLSTASAAGAHGVSRYADLPAGACAVGAYPAPFDGDARHDLFPAAAGSSGDLLGGELSV